MESALILRSYSVRAYYGLVEGCWVRRPTLNHTGTHTRLAKQRYRTTGVRFWLGVRSERAEECRGEGLCSLQWVWSVFYPLGGSWNACVDGDDARVAQ